MSPNDRDDKLIEDLLDRAAKLFREYGYPEPEKLLIRPRKFPNLQPKLSMPNKTIYLVSYPDPKEYYSQVCWVVAKLHADSHESFFVRRASVLEVILVAVLLLDGLAVVSMPHLLNRTFGLLTYLVLQSLCLVVMQRGWKGKAKRERDISNTMVSTGIWSREYADYYSKAGAEIWQYIPMLGVSIITPIAWTLFFL